MSDSQVTLSPLSIRPVTGHCGNELGKYSVTGTLENLSLLHSEMIVPALKSHANQGGLVLHESLCILILNSPSCPGAWQMGGFGVGFVVCLLRMERNHLCEEEEEGLYHLFSLVSYQIHFIPARTEKNSLVCLGQSKLSGK